MPEYASDAALVAVSDAAGTATGGAYGRTSPALAERRSALIEGLGFVRLEVTDLMRSVAFYRDGLRFGQDGSGEEASPTVRLRAGDLRLELAESAPPSRDGRGRGVQLSIEVSGVEAYHDALVARGLEPSRPIDSGRGRAFSVRDPDGYTWTFIQSDA